MLKISEKIILSFKTKMSKFKWTICIRRRKARTKRRSHPPTPIISSSQRKKTRSRRLLLSDSRTSRKTLRNWIKSEWAKTLKHQPQTKVGRARKAPSTRVARKAKEIKTKNTSMTVSTGRSTTRSSWRTPSLRRNDSIII